MMLVCDGGQVECAQLLRKGLRRHVVQLVGLNAQAQAGLRRAGAGWLQAALCPGVCTWTPILSSASSMDMMHAEKPVTGLGRLTVGPVDDVLDAYFGPVAPHGLRLHRAQQQVSRSRPLSGTLLLLARTGLTFVRCRASSHSYGDRVIAPNCF